MIVGKAWIAQYLIIYQQYPIKFPAMQVKFSILYDYIFKEGKYDKYSK